MDFLHTFTIISFTLGNLNLDNSNLPLTRSSFFHLRLFLYKFTLGNSYHALSAWQLEKSRNIEIILTATYSLSLLFCRSGLNTLSSTVYLSSFGSVHVTCILPHPISSFAVICFVLPITRTPANSNFFCFPLKVLVIGSRLYLLLNKIS